MSDNLNLDVLVDSVLAETPEAGAIGRYAYDREGYAWAVDCFWVYEHLGDRITKPLAGSPARWALWKFAKANPDKFVGQILPKAMGLLEKARDKEADSEVDNLMVSEEKKSIRELQRVLEAAILEAEAIG
jgi:hypothetical protein